ncbi:L-lactate dehydrogenase [Mycoplasma testudineum]|uniref:L-lactate dehydrogenase n=1 Tax=Mycoplasma testudineum TaxID=244584 RepID=A0A4R6ICB7_9MOLU|nr:L-lactate dehydrogenase [Mycoplasma testudineum]OYD26757.1 L-lactate dehydrogenase [Mycoplasma testudineum]TDO19893.1 L-lactate dehydrogenase [Mycoplasma testudineum]
MNHTIKSKKVAVIGTGLVGTSFMAAAHLMGLAAEYGIIDINEQKAGANAMDLEDSLSVMDSGRTTKLYNYSDLKDADVIVITAGRPQKHGETRLELLVDNAKIMKSIAESVKKSGFNGVTVINSNPVDVMTGIYAKVTGFDKNKVISSGTALEASRFVQEVASRFNLNPATVKGAVLGEHGDSSVSVFESINAGGVPYADLNKNKIISKADEDIIQENVRRKAYKIIEGKGSTFYGVGAVTAKLVRAIINDEHSVHCVGAYLTGQYGVKDIYFGTPAVLGSNGIQQILEVSLTDEKMKLVKKSAEIVKTAFESVAKHI